LMTIGWTDAPLSLTHSWLKFETWAAVKGMGRP